MASVFSSAIQSAILSILLSRLPLHPLDIPQQSSFTLKGNSGPSLHLTDLTLDIDSLQTRYLPPSTPINIRYAHVKDLKIAMSTSGIQIHVNGITCVISPKASVQDQFLDPANSIIMKGLDDPLEGLEGMVESVVGFVDAVSGANSFSANSGEDIGKWEDEIPDEEDSPDAKGMDKTSKSLKQILDNDAALAEDLQLGLETDSKPSNTILSYAMNYIMGKVFVSLEDIKVKIVADPIILAIGIDKIEADGNKTERKCTVEGLMVSVVKPKEEETRNSATAQDFEENYYEGNSKTKIDETTTPPDESDLKRSKIGNNVEDIESNIVDDDNNDNDESDSDSFNDQLMASSFMAQNKDDVHQSLLESALYTASGKSMYMSATQGDFYDAETHITDQASTAKEKEDCDKIETGSVLVTIDLVKVSFKKRQDLTIEVGKVKVCLIPIPSLLSSFLTFLIQVNKQKMVSKPKPKVEKAKSVPASNITLQLFSVIDLEISLNSNLLIEGIFQEKDSDRFHCANFILEQRSPTFIQGNLETFEILTKEDLKCLYFDDTEHTHPDIRFEFQTQGTSRITSVIMEKSLQFKIDYCMVISVLKFWNRLTPAFQKSEELKSLRLKKLRLSKSFNAPLRAPPKTSNNNASDLTLSFSSVDGSIGLSTDEQDFLDISIAPAIYDSLQKKVTVDFVNLIFNTAIGAASLKIDKIKYSDHGEAMAKFRSFDVIAQKDVVCNTKQTVTVDKISCSSSFNNLKQVFSVLGALASESKHEERKESVVQFESVPNDGKRMGSNFLSKQKKISSYILAKNVELLVEDINSDFGGLTGNMTNVGLISLMEGASHVSISQVFLERTKDGIRETIITKANKWGTAPMIFIKVEASYHIFLNNWLAYYSGKWLAMFEKETGQDKYDLPPVVYGIGVNSSSSSRRKFRKRSSAEIFLSFTDVCIGLKPVNLASEAIIVINKASSNIVIYNDKTLVVQLTSNSISLLLIDDTESVKSRSKSKNKYAADWTLLSIWKNKGYVSIGSLSTVVIKVKTSTISSLLNQNTGKDLNTTRPLIDAQLDIQKVNMNLCSDSTQCFLQTLKDLKKPVYFSYEDKYKETNSNLNVFENVQLDFFDPAVCTDGTSKTVFSSKDTIKVEEEVNKDELSVVENFYDNIEKYSRASGKLETPVSNKSSNSGEVSLNSSHFDHQVLHGKGCKIIPLTLHISVSQTEIALHDGYDWKETRTQIRSALKRVSEKAKRVANQGTTETETDGDVHEQLKTDPEEREPRNEVIEETLYASIMLGVGPRDDPNEVFTHITESIGGYPLTKARTGSSENIHAQTIDLGKSKSKPLKLKRSTKNKVLIKLEELDVNFQLLSSNEPHMKDKPDFFSNNDSSDEAELVNKIAISVNNFIITDNVPTSSWNMFAGYMREAGEREIGKNMLKVGIDLVRPIPRLAAIEMILHVNVLPLRLYVDQDTLDFLTRFGEFKDQRFIPSTVETEEMFLEKVVIDTVLLKLDYKPKKFDYAGIRSGHTSEFMNIFILDESEITLNKVTLYGVPGFSKLNNLLNGFWSPDVKKNQLAGVLSGLAPVRSIINIGSGVNNLVTVPLKEYKKDGRLVRSLQVGAVAFTKVTSGELLKLGAKLAAGTQTILENTEEAFGGSGSSARVVRDSVNPNTWKSKDRRTSDRRRRSSTASFGDEEEADYHRYFFRDKKNLIKYENGNSNLINKSGLVNDGDDYPPYNEETISDSDSDFISSDESQEAENDDTPNETYVVSLYSDQPASFNEGLKTAYGSIQKNFNTARDALYEAGVKASGSGNASSAMMELAKATPIVFIRPAIAATEAISRSLLGGVNDINPDEKRKAEEKYKKVDNREEDD
ncbi:hypothetical protein PMKS-002402 [Pichia membranifaciens]|uniref:Autophagy-related protein 2 n=1 Tax=Pichia membranifaciens TaxID=4926 RepID=A0A1Q2YHB5_9ASCO|nr:hypothetical protein PMKS-002402 [Pichia membranifaciens]